jgi:integrase/recombinase XerD
MKINLVTLSNEITNYNYLSDLRKELDQKYLLDENRNLTLGKSSERDFLEYFFAMRIFKDHKKFSAHTVRAYRADAKTLLTFMADNDITFREIGFPEVKAYNRYIMEMYANKTAIRKLDFFRRLLEFGYDTQFYKVLLSRWIEKPTVVKGHYNEFENDSPNRMQLRELTQADAEMLITYLPKIVKTKVYREQLQKRNLLIGYLLYTAGLRASELLNLNWGSFRKNHQGYLFVDVIGKGNKPRTIPIRTETKNSLFDYRESLNETTTINTEDPSPLFYSLFNKEETRQRKKRLSYQALYKIVKEAVILSEKNTKISPHWFRHTFVTVMLEQDVPLSVVKDWAGHADISTTNIYLERVNQDKTYHHLNKVSMF